MDMWRDDCRGGRGEVEFFILWRKREILKNFYGFYFVMWFICNGEIVG